MEVQTRLKRRVREKEKRRKNRERFSSQSLHLLSLQFSERRLKMSIEKRERPDKGNRESHAFKRT